MDWNIDLKEARQFGKASEGMAINHKVDNETLYHIICLAAEKYTAALSGMINYIPMHSSLTFVVRELGKKMDLPAHFLDETRYLNGFMTYCSLDIEEPKPVSNGDISRMIQFLGELAAYTENKAKVGSARSST